LIRHHLYESWYKKHKKDIKEKNKVIVEIIKQGVILFGQEEIVKILTK